MKKSDQRLAVSGQHSAVSGQLMAESRKLKADFRRISGLYAIADSGWNPFASMSELVKKFLEGGCRVIQLRMKGSPKKDVLKAAREIASFKRDCDFTFIVNDHPDVAAEAGADGVHVGENDRPVADIKREFGNGLIVGYSSHSLVEAKKAAAEGADYVAFGAIFPTRTKGAGHPVQGLPKLKAAVQSVDVPVVAIGGINCDNIAGVIETGADSVAMITALSGATDIEGTVRQFVTMFKEG